jgi:hypothetical protein
VQKVQGTPSRANTPEIECHLQGAEKLKTMEQTLKVTKGRKMP